MSDFKTIYIHTIDGQPAYFSEPDNQIVYVCHYDKFAIPAYSLAQIRKEQKITKEYRKLSGFYDNGYGYKRYRINI